MTIVLSSFRARMQATEKTLAIEALTISGGSVKPAARQVGLHHRQLWRIIRKYQLESLLNRHAARGGNAAWHALGDE